MKLVVQGNSSTMYKESFDITYNDDKYVLTNVTEITANRKYIDSNDSSKIGINHMALDDFYTFL